MKLVILVLEILIGKEIYSFWDDLKILGYFEEKKILFVGVGEEGDFILFSGFGLVVVIGGVRFIL